MLIIEIKHPCYFIFEQTFCYLLIFKHLAKQNIQLILVHYLIFHHHNFNFMANILKKFLQAFEPEKQTLVKKKLGFFSDSEGILNRYLREKENWENHLQNTKKFILQATENKDKNIAVILGSGWLLDIPLQELSSIFQKIYLVDIVHSKQVKHKISKIHNVELIEHDITGGALEGVFDLVAKYNTNNRQQLDEIELINTNFGLPANVKPDFVASVNLLSQLDYFALAYLKKHTTFCPISLGEFKEKIQKAHLSFLPKLKSCIITDYKETVYKDNDPKQLIRETFLLKVKFSDKEIANKWKWDFDTHKSYYAEGNTFMNVMALNY